MTSPTVWYITCWSGETERLIAGYLDATHGGVRIIIDNASSPETSQALRHHQSKDQQEGLTVEEFRPTIVVLEQSENLGFAHGNNVGFAHVEAASKDKDDIVVFLNSDVILSPSIHPRKRGLNEKNPTLTTVLQDCVSSAGDALYGGNIGYQQVHGSLVPYIEGWCIAGTRRTWHKLMSDALDYDQYRPWNTRYRGPYWEDNDLSLRALTHGVYLIHVDLPILHIGSGTAGSVAHHTLSYEENRSRFLADVQTTFPASWTACSTFGRYLKHRSVPSDISHHLELLAGLSQGFVVELGTRGGVSTTALLYGVERFGGHVLSIDVADCSEVHKGNQHWTFLQADSHDPRAVKAVKSVMKIMQYNRASLLFIDTIHTYEHVLSELRLWSDLDPDVICIHDTESFPGVKEAVETWLIEIESGCYECWFVTPNNGMAILRRM